MTVLEFSMKGTPRGKGRPRATVRGGFPAVYTDEKTRLYERSIRDLAGKAMRGASPFQGPLSVSLRFRLGVPKSYSKKLRAKMLAGEEPYFGAFDLDNMVKAVLDGMNAVVFLDDKQVMRLFVVKTPHEKPGVDVRVEALCEPTP